MGTKESKEIRLLSFQDPAYCSWFLKQLGKKHCPLDVIGNIVQIINTSQTSPKPTKVKLISIHRYLRHMYHKYFILGKSKYVLLEDPNYPIEHYSQSTRDRMIKQHSDTIIQLRDKGYIETEDDWDDEMQTMEYKEQAQIKLLKKKQQQLLDNHKAHQSKTWHLSLCCCIDVFRLENQQVTINAIPRNNISINMYTQGQTHRCNASVYTKRNMRTHCAKRGYLNQYTINKFSECYFCEEHWYEFEQLRSSMKCFEHEPVYECKLVTYSKQFDHNPLSSRAQEIDQYLARFLRCWYNRFFFKPTDLRHAQHYFDNTIKFSHQ